jgi:hypothetical protein
MLSDGTCAEVWHKRKLQKLPQWNMGCRNHCGNFCVVEAGAQSKLPTPPPRTAGRKKPKIRRVRRETVQSRVQAAYEAARDDENSDDIAATRHVDDAAAGNDEDADTRDAEAECF